MNHKVIHGGTIVTTEGLIEADIHIEGQTIAAIGRNLPLPDDAQSIDARGCFLLPGVIDPHTHIVLDTGGFRTADDWQSGTATAALGGVTTVIDFATQFPGQDVRGAVANRQREILGIASADPRDLRLRPVPTPFPPYIDYALHCMLTVLPETDDELAAWMSDLKQAGISAIKVYTTYRPLYYQDDAVILRSFRAAARADLVVMVHAENDAIVSAATAGCVQAGHTSLAYHGEARPALAEVEAVHRLLFLAREARCELYVVHNSVGRSVELIAEARQNGQRVYSETCPQYLLADDRNYAAADAWRWIMQPPLRDPYQPAYLMQLLASGAIDTLGTDHCDYTIAQKLGLRPWQDEEVTAALAELSPEQRALIEARLGLFDGRPRSLAEAAHVVGLEPDMARTREMEALRKLQPYLDRLQAAARELADIDWDAVRRDVQSIGGPQLPFTRTPGGLPGLQTALPLMVTEGVMAGHISWSQLAALMSTNPARIFRLYPRKGHIQVGADADIVIYDPFGEYEISDAEQATVGGFSPYAGRKVQGRVRDTLVRGAVVVRDGRLVGQPGWGQYIPANMDIGKGPGYR